jgi:hypothetical protein
MAVYVVAPAGVYTGGPTALFQLCNALRRYGVNAIVAFYGKVEGDPLHPNYRKYGCPWVTVRDIKDKKTKCYYNTGNCYSTNNFFHEK